MHAFYKYLTVVSLLLPLTVEQNYAEASDSDENKKVSAHHLARALPLSLLPAFLAEDNLIKNGEVYSSKYNARHQGNLLCFSMKKRPSQGYYSLLDDSKVTLLNYTITPLKVYRWTRSKDPKPDFYIGSYGIGHENLPFFMFHVTIIDEKVFNKFSTTSIRTSLLSFAATRSSGVLDVICEDAQVLLKHPLQWSEILECQTNLIPSPLPKPRRTYSTENRLLKHHPQDSLEIKSAKKLSLKTKVNEVRKAAIEEKINEPSLSSSTSLLPVETSEKSKKIISYTLIASEIDDLLQVIHGTFKEEKEVRNSQELSKGSNNFHLLMQAQTLSNSVNPSAQAETSIDNAQKLNN